MKKHSFLSPKCEIRFSKSEGSGIFATKGFQKGEMVALWGGVVYSSDEIHNLSQKDAQFSTHTVSIYDGFYLGPMGLNDEQDDAELFNHSCDPNIGVRGQILLVARKDIQPGEELCFDYDTTETNQEGWFYCACGSEFCRKKIDGSSWKNADFIRKNKDYLSWYILEKFEAKNYLN